MGPLTIEDVTGEYGRDSCALGTSTPRLSWRVAAGPRNWLQAAYEVKLEPAASAPVESGLIPSAESVFVPWPFDPLSSRERVTVSIRVHGDDGSVSTWSDPVLLEIGLLTPADWRGTFIGPAIDDDFRGALESDKPNQRTPKGSKEPGNA